MQDKDVAAVVHGKLIDKEDISTKFEDLGINLINSYFGVTISMFLVRARDSILEVFKGEMPDFPLLKIEAVKVK